MVFKLTDLNEINYEKNIDGKESSLEYVDKRQYNTIFNIRNMRRILKRRL